MPQKPLLAVGAPSRPYLYLLEAYRGIASVAVVLHHVGAIAHKHHHVAFLGGFFSACHLRLDFFFVLSGFIIAWLHHADLGQPRLARPFLIKRLQRIYPLLFLLTTLKLIALLIMEDGRWLKQDLDLPIILSSYLMLPSERFPIILAAWTLPYEILFYLIFAVAILSSVRVLALVAVLWSSVIIVVQLLPGIETTFPVSFFLEPFHIQLLAGTVTGLMVKKYSRPQWGGKIMAGGFACLLLGLFNHRWLESLPPLYTRGWWALVFCAIVAGSTLFETSRATPVRIPDWLRELGRASYSTYLIHSPFLVILLAWDSRHHLLDSPWKDSMLLFSAFTAVAAGLVCHRWIENPLTRWTRRRSHAQ